MKENLNMNGNDFAEDAINDIYEPLLKKIKDGKIYGVSIDLDNPKHVAVALYFAGEMKGREEATRYLEFLGK